MITLYGFGRVHRQVIGETRDLRAQRALEEAGLPYRIHALDHTGGELDGPAYSRISCFHLVPVIDDDGFIVAESAAVLLYLAEKAGKLIPPDPEGRTQVVQWCFAALTTVERPLMEIQLIDKFKGGEDDLSAVARRAKAKGESDTHQLHLMEMMDFAGSTHPAYYVLLMLTRAGPLPTNSPPGKSVSSPDAKNISLHRLVETALWIPTVPPHRGAYRDRHGRGEGCGGRGSVRRET